MKIAEMKARMHIGAHEKAIWGFWGDVQDSPKKESRKAKHKKKNKTRVPTFPKTAISLQ